MTDKRNDWLKDLVRSLVEYSHENYGVIYLPQIIERVELYYHFDAVAARHNDVDRFCRREINAIKDENGLRVIYATGNNGEFIRVGFESDLEKLDRVLFANETRQAALTRIVRKQAFLRNALVEIGGLKIDD